jgi:predicted XRE-type DNA-binding protein
MARQGKKEIPVIEGSSNVFTDLGVAEPEEELVKAQLVIHIRQSIKRQKLTQIQAAHLMGLDQPKVSALMNGRLTGFSSDRLIRLLIALGQDVEITIRPKTSHTGLGQIRVINTP